MGDMKTPDFDDLLAAFDIPDIDTNEAIHSGHEEADAHIKQVPGEPGPPDHVLPHTDITAVSVIVKNTVCPEQLDALDGRSKDGHVIGSRLLQNGFGATEMPRSPTSRSVEAVASSNGECWVKEKGPKPLDIFSHFSPDPNEDNTANLIDRPRECKAKEKSLAVPSLSPSPTLSLDCKEPMGESTENLPPAFPQPFESGQAGGAHGSPPAISCIKKEESDSEEVGREASPKGLAAALGDSPLEHLKSVTVRYSADDSPITSWPGSDPNLDSSTSNLPEVKHSPASPREPFFKPSSPVVQSPRLPTSTKHLDSIALKEEHEVLDKSMGSPQSMSSAEEEEEEEDNNNDSPSSNSSRPLKVRIKTIKTSCGSITRTVTRVSSDSEPGSTKGPPEHSSQETSLEGASFSASADKEEGIVLEVSKDKMELSSPLKSTEGPKIVSVQLGNGTKLKGTVLPVSTIQNASSAMLIAASVAQQKSMVLPAKTGKAVAKNIINLVPQTLPKADTRTSVSTVTQTSTITTTANQKVNGTTVVMVQPQKPSPTIAGTVISRSQSSLVEAFNKILNSKNLLPTYKPNLNPPADASLTLPPFGYRCLECGDAFALEKSLARHYDRRSMRIEVTCNHCTKRLVFFNKCSLLLHAREHKDKGLVMQCSHLVMRPIALDQMIGQPDITPLVSVTSFPAGKVTGVAQDTLATANGAQDLPILPLSNSSEQTNYSCFRCLECKEQCKDKAGLAAHFQQAADLSSQLPCGSNSPNKFPCHLCERSFCSAPSLRRHVRVNHEGIKRVYPCRYCTEGKRTFSSRLILEKHIQVRHGIKVTDQAKSQELSSDDGDSCSEEPDSTTPPSKTSKGDRKAPLRCRKCGYLASSSADFQEHIPQHRTDESSHQCRECGLCFTSQVSLNRHRFITHKKKKGAGELEQPGPRSPLEGGAPHAGDGKLSCKVCGRCFDSQLNLKTHFRTHGMAFIRARQNASPEN
uniref:Uncharacterized protein n=1 Tax=Melopsittacus undulatus TaxID=13146 RepID=A0A8V5GP70_MELUD